MSDNAASPEPLADVAPPEPAAGSPPVALPVAASSTTVEGELPPLMGDRAFWGMNATQFLGAFNDNLFKQLLLLVATPTVAQIAAAKAAGEPAADRQAEAMIVFAFAFLIFSGIAGWVADR
ncbi:MAG: hypothetical protein AAGG46_09975, partial [Planctomycetota bacterium]